MKEVKVFYNEKSGKNDENEVLNTIKNFLEKKKIKPLMWNISIQIAQKMQYV